MQVIVVPHLIVVEMIFIPGVWLCGVVPLLEYQLVRVLSLSTCVADLSCRMFATEAEG